MERGMSTITINDLQRDLAALLDRVEAGEHIAVAREGRVIAEIRPLESASPRQTLRPIGLAAGQFVVPEDFDAPLSEDVLRQFEGA
jgi:antitoxin (DNA-binding transcriptional repressor) of toxin-antitoxin stability system